MKLIVTIKKRDNKMINEYNLKLGYKPYEGLQFTVINPDIKDFYKESLYTATQWFLITNIPARINEKEIIKIFNSFNDTRRSHVYDYCEII
jgi:hypothetical protein